MPNKILLADDSITIQKVVELTFSDGDYEVISVNNGAKALQKLTEIRPDIILSDIIMPEKNGYEVCEYVKSHPEYRSIPVILLTGTFEPFDPDRAEKAGCDAVVTKPFESQSLVHKVEEMIQQSRAAAPAAAPAPPPAPEPEPTHTADDTTPFEPAAETRAWPQPQYQFGNSAAEAGTPPEYEAADAPFAEPGPFSAAPAEPQEEIAPPHGDEIFAAAEPEAEAGEMPFEEPSVDFSGETKAFPKFSFDDMSGGYTPPVEEPIAPPPPPPPFETEQSAAAEEPGFETSSFEQPAMETSSYETPAFEEPAFNPARDETPYEPPPLETEPWQAPFGAAEAPAEEPQPEAPPTLFDETPFGAAEEAAEPAQETASAFPESTPLFDEGPHADEFAPMAAPEESAAPEVPAFEAPRDLGETSPFDAVEPAPPALEEPSASFSAAEREMVEEEAPMPPPEAPHGAYPPPPPPPAVAAATGGSFQVTDELVERVAKRVVELISDDVIRNIAWEIIPDVANLVVKERIRQLENE